MRAMSTETMQNIISYVDQYFCDKHTTPSVNEIALGVGIPKMNITVRQSRQSGVAWFFRKYPFSLLNIQNCVIRYR